MHKKIDFFFLSSCNFINNKRTLQMFALFLLIIMYTGAVWYTPPPPQKQRKQFRFVESTTNNVTYDRDHLF